MKQLNFKQKNSQNIEIPPFLQDHQDDLLSYVRESVIGDFHQFYTVFGKRSLIYADYVASGRALSFIQDYLTAVVLPYYANTHTFTSWVGLQTLNLRAESREIIKACVNATALDALLFVGSGATGAVNKLVRILENSRWGDQGSNFVDRRSGTVGCSKCNQRFLSEGIYIKHLDLIDHVHDLQTQETTNTTPLVFVGIFEHHSNLLPWREAGAEIVMIYDNDEGTLDLASLEENLKKYRNRVHKIGSFSAASNINGILLDVKAVTRLLKSYGALAFFDYAAAAPYVVIDMNPSPEEAIDGIFFSGHKFVGGPGTPGVLIIKRSHMGNDIPAEPGGGTVFFVTKSKHSYLANPEEKEEGGTPDILGSIQLGLVFQVKAAIGDRYIYHLETQHYKKVSKILDKIPNIVVFGSLNAERLPIFSFLIKHGEKYFHYAFIAALLNDLFGIETRGGCACAGPYALRLLKINDEVALQYEKARRDGYELYLPGFVRLSINYFLQESTVEYIIDALKFIAKYAIYFLPQYRFTLNKKTTVHRDSLKNRNLKNSLPKLGAFPKPTEAKSRRNLDPVEKDLHQYIRIAYSILDTINVHKYLNDPEDSQDLDVPPEIESLRWFVLPSEARLYMQNTSEEIILDNERARKPILTGTRSQHNLLDSDHIIYEKGTLRPPKIYLEVSDQKIQRRKLTKSANTPKSEIKESNEMKMKILRKTYLEGTKLEPLSKSK